MVTFNKTSLQRQLDNLEVTDNL